MESLDAFRQFWYGEISKETPTNTTKETEHTPEPEKDLCRLGINSKRSLDCDTPIPPASQWHEGSGLTTNNASFTIGIRTFSTTTATTTNSSAQKPSVVEVPTKKLKAQPLTLIDELIRDIDELTHIPFFNLALPREIALKIFDYLSMADLFACLQVGSAWHSISCDELLWHNLYRRSHFDPSKALAVEQSWKDHVRDAIQSNKQLVQNFKSHQCRTTKLTYRLGHVLTCATNNSSTIVAGYSTGIIRTWCTQSILDADENNNGGDDQSSTPEIIYESTDTNQESDLSSVKAVGLLTNEIYAMHDNGLLEVWSKDVGNKPHYTSHVTNDRIAHVANDEHRLCMTSKSRLYAWNFPELECQEMNFVSEYNEHIVSMCMSGQHSVPISIVATNRSFWCISLADVKTHFAFYSFLPSDSTHQIALDVHDEEPIAVLAIDNQIKLFDLQSARFNILATNYTSLPARVRSIRARQCPVNEFLVAFHNYQISIFDRRQKNGAVQHFHGHHAPITTFQMDSWKLVSTDTHGFVRLWDRRMHPQSLWHINPHPHPVTHCSFDKQTLICALTPIFRDPDQIDYQINSEPYSGQIYVCDFQSDISTQLDADLQICTSTYDAPEGSNRRLALSTPYDLIE